MTSHRPFLGALAILVTLTLSACGGGTEDNSASATPRPEQQAARTAPEIPVIPSSAYAASGPNSYGEAVDHYNAAGEAIHGSR